MDFRFYHLEANPFVAPAAGQLFWNAKHQEVWNELAARIEAGQGVIGVIGEAGLGKTALLQAYRALADPQRAFVIEHPEAPPSQGDLLIHLVLASGLPLTENAPGGLFRAVYQHCSAMHADGRRMVWLIDDAHAWPVAALAQLQALCERLRQNGAPLLQIVLCGRPALQERCQHPDLHHLAQALRAPLTLSPLAAHERVAYIEHYLQGGAAPASRIFTKGALKLIVDYTQGIPKLINIACSDVLVAGLLAGEKPISTATVKSVLGDNEASRLSPLTRWAVASAAGLALVAGLWSLSLQNGPHAAPTSALQAPAAPAPKPKRKITAKEILAVLTAEPAAPAAVAPEASASNIEAPEAAAPEVNAPEVDTPEAARVEANASQVETPEAAAPEAAAPEAAALEANAPEVAVSEAAAPEATVSQVVAPAASLSSIPPSATALEVQNTLRDMRERQRRREAALEAAASDRDGADARTERADAPVLASRGVEPAELPSGAEAHPSPPPRSQTALIASARAGLLCAMPRPGGQRVSDIVLWHDAESGARRLIDDGSHNMSPTLSPDGAYLAYTSSRDGAPNIYVRDLASGQETQLTSGAGLALPGAWSPNGRYLAFSHSVQGNSDIFVYDLKAQRLQRLTRDKAIDISPSFAPDGRRLVFASTRTGSPQLYITDMSGAPPVRVTYSGAYNTLPSWSPRGEDIAFVGRSENQGLDLYTIKPNGAERRRLTRGQRFHARPAWLPDGQTVMGMTLRGDAWERHLAPLDPERAAPVLPQPRSLCLAPQWVAYRAP